MLMIANLVKYKINRVINQQGKGKKQQNQFDDIRLQIVKHLFYLMKYHSKDMGHN